MGAPSSSPDPETEWEDLRPAFERQDERARIELCRRIRLECVRRGLDDVDDAAQEIAASLLDVRGVRDRPRSIDRVRTYCLKVVINYRRRQRRRDRLRPNSVSLDNVSPRRLCAEADSELADLARIGDYLERLSGLEADTIRVLFQCGSREAARRTLADRGLDLTRGSFATLITQSLTHLREEMARGEAAS